MNAVDETEHALNGTDCTDDDQAEMGNFNNRDLIYLLSFGLIPYLFIIIMVMLLFATNWIMARIVEWIKKNQVTERAEDEVEDRVGDFFDFY